MWVTNLRHFLDDTGALIESRPGRIAAYFAEIVQIATPRMVGAWSLSEVRCRRRPGHKLCTGRIGVRLTDTSLTVEWECPECGDAGIVSDWEDTRWDLRPRGRQLTHPRSAGSRVLQMSRPSRLPKVVSSKTSQS